MPDDPIRENTPSSWYWDSFRLIFSSEHGAFKRLRPRWLFLRAIGLIYFSAFYSLLRQVRGLIGTDGLLPAREYLQNMAHNAPGWERFWYAPTLYWISSSTGFIVAVCWIGLVASLLLVFNFWPRGMLFVCFVCFLSFVAASSDFSSYQSDGMLLEAGFICLFFAPPGFRPGMAAGHPASRASLFLLQFEWLRIYFESGLVKLASGDPQWRNFTAMDEYYQNGPLPTWIGWFVQHLPHRFHAFTVGATLVMELGLIWMILLPRQFRIVLFCLVSCWELGVIATANYAFLNYLVLALGILLVDDHFVSAAVGIPVPSEEPEMEREARNPILRHFRSFKLAVAVVMLTWIFYATSVEMLRIVWRNQPFPLTPIAVLSPFRIANQYGLFAVMTRNRYEIEFQGSDDGQNWTAYPFRYKPQAVSELPRFFAPYQPRFDWNLWFASLDTWRDNGFVPAAEVSLLQNDRAVLKLFAGNPFPNAPPKQVRAVLWQYWFTSMEEQEKTGNWWRREYLGLYAPTLELGPNGSPQVIEMPDLEAPQP